MVQRDSFRWKKAHFRMEYFVYFKKMQRISSGKQPLIQRQEFLDVAVK